MAKLDCEPGLRMGLSLLTEKTTRMGSSWLMVASVPVLEVTRLPLVRVTAPIRPSMGAMMVQ